MGSAFYLDNRFRLRRGGLHLSFKLGGKRIGYAYIRKNGCSAFKNALGFEPTTNVSLIAAQFPWRIWQRNDANIFVWRDPVERLVSLYRNKILDQYGSSDIIRMYRQVMHEEPSTFEKFVEFCCLEADPHCIRQSIHLKSIFYTHAIPLSDLHETMSQLVGAEAATPFKEPVNASSTREPVEVPDAAISLIHKHYAADYEMIERIKATGAVSS